MVITQSDKALDFFSLEDLSSEEQEEFLEEVGSLVMQRILHRAWAELTVAQKDTLTELLEESSADSVDNEKQDAVFTFLDEHVPQVREMVHEELTHIQDTFEEYQDELLSMLT